MSVDVTDMIHDWLAQFDAVSLFGGPGGWCEGAATLGVRCVGIEWDEDACATARAAGHARIQADVSRLDPARFAAIPGLIGSPPCPTFSAAGSGTGKHLLDLLADAMRRMGRGEHVMASTRRACARALQREALTDRKLRHLPRRERSAWAWRYATMSVLVLEPLRWALANRPQWIALEQVPSVLPLWKVMGVVLRDHGYTVDAGVLSAERYGVPQTRKRAILAASQTGWATLPAPTHKAYEPRGTDDAADGLFDIDLADWVSMSDALGFGMHGRPSMTVTGGGTAAGGAEPFGHGARQQMHAHHTGGGGLRAYRLARGTGMNERYGDRPDTPVTRPAPVITSKARTASWVTGGAS